MCVLIHRFPAPAALLEVSATAAFIETSLRPSIGEKVELHHPEAGAIAGVVRSLTDDGIGIGFDYGIRSVAFALAAITADMSRPAL